MSGSYLYESVRVSSGAYNGLVVRYGTDDPNNRRDVIYRCPHKHRSSLAAANCARDWFRKERT